MQLPGHLWAQTPKKNLTWKKVLIFKEMKLSYHQKNLKICLKTFYVQKHLKTVYTLNKTPLGEIDG